MTYHKYKISIKDFILILKDEWKYRNRVNTTARYIIWGGENISCYGKYQRGICIFSVKDLSRLVNRHEIFANKFYLNYNPIAYQCMEEWIMKKIKLKSSTVNSSMYCHHPVLSIYNKDIYCGTTILKK